MPYFILSQTLNSDLYNKHYFKFILSSEQNLWCLKEAKESIQKTKESPETLETIKKMRQDIRDIKHTSNKIKENINLTKEKADEALQRSTKATVTPKESHEIKFKQQQQQHTNQPTKRPQEPP